LIGSDIDKDCVHCDCESVFHNRAPDILRRSKQWWTLASKISRGSGPSNPRRIDAYGFYYPLSYC